MAQNLLQSVRQIAGDVWRVTLGTATTGGATPYHLISAGSTNATVVKNAAGTLYGWSIYNNNAAQLYVKFYNKATTPNPAADTVVLTVLVPGATAGSGTNMPISSMGCAFSTGISFATVTGAGDTNNSAVGSTDLIINLFYA